MPRVWKLSLLQMYRLYGTDFYLNLTLRGELYASNIVFFFPFLAMRFHFPSRLLFVHL